MGELSNVDSEKIVATAARMGDEVEQVKNGVMAFRDAIAKLESSWQSENKAIFMQSFEADSEAMAEMVVQMGELCDTLRQAAQSFDESEGNVAGKVGNLKF